MEGGVEVPFVGRGWGEVGGVRYLGRSQMQMERFVGRS